MANLTLRSVKGSPLTNAEVDGNFTALNTEINTKLDSDTYTANDILTKLKTVDGHGSGLDAEMLDGIEHSTNPPGAIKVTSVARTAGTSIIVTSEAHGFTVGQSVKIFATIVGDIDVSFNGTFTIVSVPSATSYTFLQNGLANVPTTAQTYAQSYVTITKESIPSRALDGSMGVTDLYALNVYGNLVGTLRGDVLGNITGTSENVTGIVALGNGGTGSSTVEGARSNLGLGTMAVQNANAVSITGGTITSLTTDLAIADGGTGASNAAAARTNLGLQIGTDIQAFDADLTALAALSTTGVVVRTGNAAFSSTSNLQLDNLGVGTAANTVGTGEIRATGDIITSYSDERLKEDISQITDALELLEQIQGVRFKTNALAESFGYKNKDTQLGLLAQQVKNVFPEAVKPAPFDTINLNETLVSRSGENYLTVQYEKLVPVLVEAIKQLNKKIEALENK